MKILFYKTDSGKNPVEEFLIGLPETTRREVMDAFLLLEAGQSLSMPLSRNLSSIASGLNELRFRDRAGSIRVFYYIIKKDAIYVLHAMRKKTRELPKSDIALIKKRMREI